MSLFGSLFSKRKSDQAIDALKTQFNIDLYESGHFQTDRRNKYKVSISDTDDCIAVINRGRDNTLMAKEWYLYDKKSGQWIKKAALNRQQSVRLYMDTKPYYVKSLLEELGGHLTREKEDACSLIICDEYLSSYMTSHYFGFSIRVNDDYFWAKGSHRTEAIYMPHRSSPPEEETEEERIAREKRIDALVDQLADVIKKGK